MKTIATVFCFLVLFSLSHGRSVHGLIIDSEGAPVEGLSVSFQVLEGASILPVFFTDEHGRFFIPNLPNQDLHLIISGEKGTGRVFLEEGKEGALPVITYPVRTEVIILHDNDRHFYMNHQDELELFVEQWRRSYDNVFLVNAGDLLVRHRHRWKEDNHVPYYKKMGMRLVESMNRLRYDLVVLGNHENAWIEDATLKILEALDAPLLGANIEVNTPNYVTPQPYEILITNNGLRLAVLGLSVGRGVGVEILDFAETIQRFRHLREENHAFILGTHIGLNNDRALARQFPEIDLIIGGHTHDLLTRGERVGDVLIVHAGGHPHVDGGYMDPDRAMFMGVVRLVFKNEDLKEKSARVHFIEAQPAKD